MLFRSMAAQFPDKMEKLVLCCAGVCLEEKDLEEGFFNVSDLDEALSILLPQTPEKLRELMRFSFVKPGARWVPSYFLTDFIDVRFTFPITCSSLAIFRYGSSKRKINLIHICMLFQ